MLIEKKDATHISSMENFPRRQITLPFFSVHIFEKDFTAIPGPWLFPSLIIYSLDLKIRFINNATISTGPFPCEFISGLSVLLTGVVAKILSMVGTK